MKYLYRKGGKYIYFRRDGVAKRLPDEASPEFAVKYAELLSLTQRARPKRHLIGPAPRTAVKHKGARSEFLAIAWLLGEGFEVFRNVSQHGNFDLIVAKDGVMIPIDVKSVVDRHRDGQKPMTPAQIAAGIRPMYVWPDGRVKFVIEKK
jgi:hypothetical protein